MASPLSLDNPVFRSYVFYASILGAKMLIMSFLTAIQRFKKGAFANPEDTKGRSNAKVKVDEDVERVRRAHLNDVENIPVFLFVAGLYIFTNPAPALAINLFRVFTLARITHTLVYAVVVVPQPARALSFGIGLLVTGYIIARNVLYFA